MTALPSPRSIARLLPEADPDSLVFEPLRSGGVAALLRRRQDGAPIAFDLGPGGRPRRLSPEDDPALPGARLLADWAALAARLHPVLASVETVALAAYHPGRRATARIEGRSGRGRRAAVYLKLLRPAPFARAARALAALSPVGRSPLRLAAPVRFLGAEAALVVPAAPGRALHDLVLAGADLAIPFVARALRALAARVAPPGLPPRGLEEERGSTLTMLDRAAAVGAAGRLAGLAEAVRRAALPRGSGSGLVHGDLHDKQVFIARGRVTLIDVEGLGAGDARIDAVNLAEHLRLRALEAPRRARGGAAARSALLGALGLDEEGDPAVRALVALVRARLAAVCAQRPRHRALADRLAAEAAAALRALA